MAGGSAFAVFILVSLRAGALARAGRPEPPLAPHDTLSAGPLVRVRRSEP